MELTPIRVRGKRRPARPQSARPASSRPATPAGSSASSARHNPYAMVSSSRPSSRPGAAPPASSPPRQRRKVSLERRLPNELLEKIFLLSKNLNFARCSPLIGLALSGRGTLIHLTITAFGPTWDAYFGTLFDYVNGRYGTGPAHQPSTKLDNHRKPFVGDVKLQTAVLQCRWATASLLLDAQETWYRNQPKMRDFSHITMGKEDTSMPEFFKVFTKSPAESQIQRLLNIHPLCGRHNMQLRGHGAASIADHQAADGRLYADAEAASSPPLGQQARFLRHGPCLHDCMEFDLAIMAHRVALPDRSDPGGERITLDTIDKTGEILHPGTHTRWQKERCLVDTTSDEFRRLETRVQLALRPLRSLFGRRTLMDVAPGVRIPERLLLAGGPFSDDDLRRDRRALRKRLREVVDMLFWLVRGGATLHAQDSWEVTFMGLQHLMDIDLREHQEGLEEGDGDDGDDAKGKYKEKTGRTTIDDDDTSVTRRTREERTPLSYSTDMLVAMIISLFCTLEVFFTQWPYAMHTTVWERLIMKKLRTEPSFASSRTYALLYRVWTLHYTHAVPPRLS